MPPGKSSSGVSCAPVRPAVPYRVYILIDLIDLIGLFSRDASGVFTVVPYRTNE